MAHEHIPTWFSRLSASRRGVVLAGSAVTALVGNLFPGQVDLGLAGQPIAR